MKNTEVRSRFSEGLTKELQFDQVEEFLIETLPAAQQILFSGKRGLRRMETFLDFLGRPHEKLRVIHIAGTSGKSSASQILTELLSAHGFTVGTELSPHTYDIRERLTINGRLISKDDFVKLFHETWPVIQQMQNTPYGYPTYFETMTGMAMKLFADRRTDYAVIETGIGGMLDPTNIVQKPDKLALITRLGLDHTHILGRTLEEIAAQKAGIIPQNGQSLFISPKSSSVRKVIESFAGRQAAAARAVNPDIMVKESATTDKGSIFDYTGTQISVKKLRLSLLGKHQIENAIIALQALELLAERDNFEVDAGKIRQTFASIRIPGRCELIPFNGHHIIADGAHNPQKMDALLATIQEHYGKEPLTWIIAAKGGKEASDTYRRVKPFVRDMIVTQYESSALQRFVTPVNDLAQIMDGVDLPVRRAPNISVALDQAIAINDPSRPIVVTGSIYLLGELHRAITGT